MFKMVAAAEPVVGTKEAEMVLCAGVGGGVARTEGGGEEGGD